MEVLVMLIPIEEELRAIAREIVAEDKSLEEWAEVESDDMFSEGRYAGGFEALESEFCFSYYGEDGERWFQLSLAQVREIADGGTPAIAGRLPG